MTIRESPRISPLSIIETPNWLPTQSAEGTDPLLDELGSILFDCLRLQRKSYKAIGHILDAIRMRVLEAGATRCLPSQKNRVLQPWQELLATRLLLAPSSDRPTIANVARACGMTPTQFSQAFKTRFGQLPQQWRLAARIERAKSMMLDTSYSLTDIAIECGFAEQSHFNHTFFNRVGSCPSTWRKLHSRTVANTDAMDDVPV